MELTANRSGKTLETGRQARRTAASGTCLISWDAKSLPLRLVE